MRITQLSFGAALALALAAHGAQAQTTLRAASQGDALTLDPHAQNEGPTNTMNQQMYEPLIERAPDQSKVPALATSWEVIEPTVWEFKLREGVTFHGGQEFTAEDVVFSYERAKAETSDFKEQVDLIERIEVVDDHTIRMHTAGPNPVLPDQITEVLIVDSGWAEENNVVEPQNFAGGEETFAVRNTNGTGPYRLELREPDVRTILVKNEEWWGSGMEEYPFGYDRVEYTPISNAATRLAALRSGEVDYLLDPPLQNVPQLENTPGIKVQTIPQIRTIFFGMDVGSESLRSSDAEGNPFADPKVRQAMARAIDIEAIQSKIMRGLSEPAGIVTSPGVNGFTEALDEREPYDLEAAKQLMSESGYPDGFEVTLDCPNDRYNNDESICQAVVGMLAQINIDVNLAATTKTLHFPKIQNRETDFYLLGWGVPTLDSHYVFSYLFDTEGSWNATGYSNPELDKLIDDMATQTDLAERDRLIQRAWEIAKADGPYLPLHHQVIAWAMDRNVTIPMDPQDQPKWARAAPADATQ